MKLIRNEISQVLTELDFDNVLEVGVGELTTLESVYRQFGPNIDCYGVDLSLNRIYHGLKEFKKRHTKLPNVVKANAIHLPFPDNSFDLVFTRHTIEQMPTIYKEVLNEIIRVSRKQVVLFEPSYELASFPQKLKMHNTDYVKGISKYLKSKKNIELDKKFLMKNSANPLNHTACFKFKTLSKNLKENMGLVSLVCPLTKKTLEKKDSFYYCKDSSRAYPIIHGIPVLDSDYSFYVTEKKSHSLPTKNDIWHKKIKE